MTTQYQSFPDAPGDSGSRHKLIALRLPSLVGKRFLDIGCNEGFFCGYAKFAGAQQVVGLDASDKFITRARQRFPDVEFLHQSWDALPPGPFDVVLLASSLHYAHDQADLIHRAMQVLAPGGTLVLELGIAPGEQSAWVEVERGIDKRLFPTWSKLTELLAPYAHKRIANSVMQKGDPVPRYTLHINVRKPVAYLLLQPPGFGKSTLANELFRPAGLRVVSCDECLMEMAAGTVVPADEQLRSMVAANCSAVALDKTLIALVDANLLPALVQVWLDKAGGQTFALDAYLPAACHEQTKQLIKSAGYLVVTLEWDRPGAELTAALKVDLMAQAWVAELARPPGEPLKAMPFGGTLGSIIALDIGPTMLEVRGWAVHESGVMPKLIGIRLGDHMTLYPAYDRDARPKIQAWLGLPHAMYGFRIRQPIPPGIPPADVPRLLQIYGGNAECSLSGPFSRAELNQPSTAV